MAKGKRQPVEEMKKRIDFDELMCVTHILLMGSNVGQVHFFGDPKSRSNRWVVTDNGLKRRNLSSRAKDLNVQQMTNPLFSFVVKLKAYSKPAKSYQNVIKFRLYFSTF